MLACRAAVLVMESLLDWASNAAGFWGILIGVSRELLLLDNIPCIRPTWTTSPTTPVVEADPYAYPQPHKEPHPPCTCPPVYGASTRQSQTHAAAYHPPIHFTPSHFQHLSPVVLTPVVLNKKGSTATNQGKGAYIFHANMPNSIPSGAVAASVVKSKFTFPSFLMECPLSALALFIAPPGAGWSSVPSVVRLNSACGRQSSAPSLAHSFSALSGALLQRPRWRNLSASSLEHVQQLTLSWFWRTPSHVHAVSERPHCGTVSPMLAGFSASTGGHPDGHWHHCQHPKTSGCSLVLFLYAPSADWPSAPSGAAL